MRGMEERAVSQARAGRDLVCQRVTSDPSAPTEPADNCSTGNDPAMGENGRLTESPELLMCRRASAPSRHGAARRQGCDKLAVLTAFSRNIHWLKIFCYQINNIEV